MKYEYMARVNRILSVYQYELMIDLGFKTFRPEVVELRSIKNPIESDEARSLVRETIYSQRVKIRSFKVRNLYKVEIELSDGRDFASVLVGQKFAEWE